MTRFNSTHRAPRPPLSLENGMHDSIAPHGGLTEPVNRQVPADEVADFRASAAALKRVDVSDADLSSLYRFGDGGLSPLVGPMDRAAFDRALDEEVIVH